MEGFNFAALDFSPASNPLERMEWADTRAGTNSPEVMPVESRVNRESVRVLTSTLQTLKFQLNIFVDPKQSTKQFLIDRPKHFCWQ